MFEGELTDDALLAALDEAESARAPQPRASPSVSDELDDDTMCAALDEAEAASTTARAALAEAEAARTTAPPVNPPPQRANPLAKPPPPPTAGGLVQSGPSRMATAPGALCRCGKVRERREAGPQSNFPGRAYYNCSCANGFEWADAADVRTSHLSAAGPACKCGKASVQKRVKKDGPTKGRPFWCCAKGQKEEGGCNFFEWQEPSSSSSVARAAPAAAPRPQRPPLPGFANHMSDWREMAALQRMFDVGDGSELGVGADVRERTLDYDTLDVVAAWRITNPQRRQKYDTALERVRTACAAAGGASDVALPRAFTDAAAGLGGASRDSTQAGEALLLHGTSPEHLHGILFEGLDPERARNGYFGRGTYFAENAAKIDQYTSLDVKWNKQGDQLHKLHSRLYNSVKHPGRVRYALVCRVALGLVVRTRDGETQSEPTRADSTDDENVGGAAANTSGTAAVTAAVTDGARLFLDDERTALAPLQRVDGYHNTPLTPTALLAELGGRIHRFREFVLFKSDQIFVEYLVAYKRERKRCDCGELARETTVVKSTDNFGRSMRCCAHERGSDENCGFLLLLPVCDCGVSAAVKTVVKPGPNCGRQFYTCASGRHGCDFFEWKPDVSEASAAASLAPQAKCPRVD